MKTTVALLGLLFAAGTAFANEPWTLQRALDYALAHNPDAQIAQQRIQAARAGLDEADSAFWPKLQFQSSYARTDNPMMVFGDILDQHAYNYAAPPNFNNLPNVDNWNVQGTVTVPLYAGGRNEAEHDAARADTEAARHSNAAVRNDLAFEVVSAFETVLKARDFARAAKAAVNSFDHDLTVARKRHDSGTLLKSDVLDIEVQLGQAREELIRAQNAETLATLALRNLIGIDDGGFGIADTAPAVSVPPAGDSPGRPELAAASEREAAAEAMLRGAQSGYQPRVSAFGSLGHDYGWATDGHGNNYTAGIVLQWDLWDGLLTRGKSREASANLAAERQARRKLRLAIDFEIEEARLNLDAATQELAVAGKSVEEAEESAKLTRDRFEQGLAIPSRLIDSETALTTARVRHAEAQADERIAIAALRKALALPQLDASPAAK